jgi:hypothetical protein
MFAKSPECTLYEEPMKVEDRGLVQCVERGLDAFGVNMKQATYSALGSDADTFQTKIIQDPDSLEDALKIVFGSGYVFAERSIIREMKKKFDLEFPASSYTMTQAIKIASEEIRGHCR